MSTDTKKAPDIRIASSSEYRHLAYMDLACMKTTLWILPIIIIIIITVA